MTTNNTRTIDALLLRALGMCADDHNKPTRSTTKRTNNYHDDTYPIWHCVVWYFKPSKAA